MDRTNHQDVRVFVGTEVEKTMAYGRKTLFLVGLHRPEWIVDTAARHECTHVYFGANQSFAPVDNSEWRAWESMIIGVLDSDPNLLATLDFDVSLAHCFIESRLSESHRLIPMISVKLPYVNQLGYNAVVKIDDTGFAASNPGVWCHNLHELRSAASFTSWLDYTCDTQIPDEFQGQESKNAENF